MSGSGSTEAVDHPEYGGGASPRRCAACKYLRRRCASDCVLAPYFPASQPQRYANVHAVFGTSNVTRLLQASSELADMILKWACAPLLRCATLQSLPVQERGPAADTMAAEAYWRVQDPVYGCTGVISRLQEEIRAAQRELARTRAQLAVQMHGGGTASQHHSAPRHDGTAAMQAPSSSSLLLAPPDAAAYAVAHASGGHRGVERGREEEEAPMMNPDEFLDLGDL
ncbi:hypothetical protein ACP70R_016126 [Stipagrostis hirtigluma subsp. patula]